MTTIVPSTPPITPTRRAKSTSVMDTPLEVVSGEECATLAAAAGEELGQILYGLK